MRLVLLPLIIYSGFWAVQTERFNFHSRVGVVDANDERRLCLNISNPHLTDGTSITLVLPHKPQRVAKAVIESKASRTCSRDPFAEAESSFYWLKLVGNSRVVDLSEPLPPTIGIVSARPFSVKRGVASGDLDGDGRAEFFRICPSMEGDHLTIWSGQPLVGRRRWHAYYYLGYDIVAKCKKKDYQ